MIFAAPGASAAFAVKRLTTTIPIVFYTSGDAVELGLVENLNRPDGNLTGVSGVTNSLITKQLELLTDLVPKSLSFALLTNPASPNTNDLVRNVRRASDAIGLELRVVNASNENELDAAFRRFRKIMQVVLSSQPIHFLALDASGSRRGRQAIAFLRSTPSVNSWRPEGWSAMASICRKCFASSASILGRYLEA